MAYYDYNHLANIGFGIAWLDISDQIKDSTALALSKNITEYWVQENENFSLKTTCKKDVDAILSWAADEKLSYVLVAAIGCNLSKRDNLHNELPKFLERNPNFAIAGHILDKGDKFYELHHQCFIVNINWWRNNTRPLVGKEEYNTPWETAKPIRSEENWHDGYTPKWIKQGSELTSYTGRRFGWNIIDRALRSGNNVISFDDVIRDSKFYIYPEVTSDFHTKIASVLDGLQGWGHFAANTESPPDKVINVEFDGAICTAGGITPLLTAFVSNLKPGGKLTVFDFSPLSLEVQRELRNSSCNYKNFKEDFNNLFGKLDLRSGMVKAERNIDRMQEIIDSLMKEGLEEFIENVWPHLNVIFVPCNLFDVYHVKNRLVSRHSNEKTYVHLTNILHYQNTAWLFSATSRYRLEEDILKMFAEDSLDNFYFYQNRPGLKVNWRNQTPRQIFANPDKLLYRVKELGLLPWTQL